MVKVLLINYRRIIIESYDAKSFPTPQTVRVWTQTPAEILDPGSLGCDRRLLAAVKSNGEKYSLGSVLNHVFAIKR